MNGFKLIVIILLVIVLLDREFADFIYNAIGKVL